MVNTLHIGSIDIPSVIVPVVALLRPTFAHSQLHGFQLRNYNVIQQHTIHLRNLQTCPNILELNLLGLIIDKHVLLFWATCKELTIILNCQSYKYNLLYSIISPPIKEPSVRAIFGDYKGHCFPVVSVRKWRPLTRQRP